MKIKNSDFVGFLDGIFSFHDYEGLYLDQYSPSSMSIKRFCSIVYLINFVYKQKYKKEFLEENDFIVNSSGIVSSKTITNEILNNYHNIKGIRNENKAPGNEFKKKYISNEQTYKEYFRLEKIIFKIIDKYQYSNLDTIVRKTIIYNDIEL